MIKKSLLLAALLPILLVNNSCHRQEKSIAPKDNHLEYHNHQGHHPE